MQNNKTQPAARGTLLVNNNQAHPAAIAGQQQGRTYSKEQSSFEKDVKTTKTKHGAWRIQYGGGYQGL